MSFSSRRRNYMLKRHRRDGLFEFMRRANTYEDAVCRPKYVEDLLTSEWLEDALDCGDERRLVRKDGLGRSLLLFVDSSEAAPEVGCFNDAAGAGLSASSLCSNSADGTRTAPVCAMALGMFSASSHTRLSTAV